MRLTLRSILVISVLAILASISVAFYLSVIAQDFEMYISEDESEYLEDDVTILDDEEVNERMVSKKKDTPTIEPGLIPVDFEQSEDQAFAPPVSEDS